MASYILKSKTDAIGNDISTTSSDAKVACDNDLTCVGYSNNITLNKATTYKNKISTYSSSAANDFYEKDYKVECPKKTTLNDNYLGNFCLNSTLVTNSDDIKSSILSSEQSKPLMLIIGYEMQTTTSTTTPTTALSSAQIAAQTAAKTAANMVAQIAATNTVFTKPIYVLYKNTPTILGSELINILNNKTQALKLFCYANIQTAGSYKFIINKGATTVKLFIDTIPISLTTFSSSTNVVTLSSDATYLTSGDHLMYLEITNATTEFNFDPWFLPSSVSTVSDTYKLKNYIKTPYTLYSTIKGIKNSTDMAYCSPTNFTSDAYCGDLIKNGTTLNSDVLSSCLDSSGLYTNNATCDPIVLNAIKKDTSVNSDLIKKLADPVLAWYLTKLKNIGADTSATTELEIKKLEQYYPHLKAYNKSAPISDNLTGLVKYCENKVGDKFSYDNDNSICGLYYNDSSINNSTLFTSKNNIQTKYCTTTPAGSTQVRYETDAKCKDMIKNGSLLQSTISNRCLPDNKWNIDDKYCNDLVDTNINNPTPVVDNNLLKTLVTSKNTFVTNEISNISDTNPILKSEKYITDIYSKYGSRDENTLINDNFINYCLTKDSNLKKSSCGPIYNAYPANTKVGNSRVQMRSKNCITQDNLLTDLDTVEATASNTNKCKTLVFDSTNPSNVAMFSKTATDYCSKDSNIIGDTCKTYFNNIETNLVKNQFSEFDVNKLSSFENKEGMINKENLSTRGMAVEGDEGKLPIWAYFLIVIAFLLFIRFFKNYKKDNKKKIHINRLSITTSNPNNT